MRGDHSFKENLKIRNISMSRSSEIPRIKSPPDTSTQNNLALISPFHNKIQSDAKSKNSRNYEKSKDFNNQSSSGAERFILPQFQANLKKEKIMVLKDVLKIFPSKV